MTDFIYEQQQSKLIFGRSFTRALSDELPNNTVLHAWVIASRRFNSVVQAADSLDNFFILEHFSRVLQYVPADQVQKARHSVAKSGANIIMAIGGGSAIGLAKAVALKHPLPIWAVPTTYSGSEMTNIYGISSAGIKEVGRDLNVVPEKVFYDPELSLTLPFDIAAKSALNALSHLIEAVYSSDRNPFTFQHSLEGIRILFSGLKRLSEEKSISAVINEKLLLGASFAGKSLSETEMALHHTCAHVLGGSFSLDHASVHTVMLPYVLKFQWSSLSDEIRIHFKRLFDSDTPANVLFDLIKRLDQPTSLKDIGFRKRDIAKAAELISNLKFNNPATVTQDNIKRLLETAWGGKLS